MEAPAPLAIRFGCPYCPAEFYSFRAMAAHASGHYRPGQVAPPLAGPHVVEPCHCRDACVCLDLKTLPPSGFEMHRVWCALHGERAHGSQD